MEDSKRIVSKTERVLSEIEEEKMCKQDARLVSEFKAKQCEQNSQKHWDIFYKRNETRFFKDRHWTTREFHELLGNNFKIETPSLLEVGCGVGNLIFPLIEENTKMTIYACDFSSRAVEFVRSHVLYDSGKINVFQADATCDDLFEKMGKLVDVVTIVFVMSAIHPLKFENVLKNIYCVLKPGGIVLFRDYGVLDMTQIRFKPGNKIMDNMYLRQDGTTTYFFSIKQVEQIFENCNFQLHSCYYVQTRTVNMKEGIDVPRVFVQAKFLKPIK